MDIEVCIPENDCVGLISQFVEEMELTALYRTYERLPAENHPSPAIMLKIMLYAYHEGKGISSRSIEKNCRRDINYMCLLEGKSVPDHATIARFRTKHFAACPEQLLAETASFLSDLGQITETEAFIDGTKIEANAGRCTFVWKKSATKHQKKFPQKTALLVGDIIDRHEMEPPWNRLVKKKDVKKLLKKLTARAHEKGLEFVSGRGHKKQQQLQRDMEDLKESLAKIKEHGTKIHICGNRNSHSKTDNDAAFMHVKDDHMKNGQLKPAYNPRHAVNSGFIVAAGIFQNPTDAPTLKPFVEQMETTLTLRFKRLVADAGHESEENLKYLEEKGIGAFIKPANYEQRGTKKLAKQIGRRENMQYDEQGGFYICHDGKHIEKSYERKAKTATGYIRTETHYHCSDCGGCPYRAACMPGKNRKKPVEQRHKHLVASKDFERLRADEYERIDGPEGKELRMNRSIQVEGSFADVKADSAFARFLCRGSENVLAESILFAMAHNLGWLHSRIQNDKLEEHLYELKETA